MTAQHPIEAVELYERGGEHDSAGREEQAIPLYEQALAAGLAGELRARCLLQLGSSLRNVGRVSEAVALLENARREFPDFRALRAFVALALHSAGHHREALRELLETIADEGDYQRSLRSYAAELANFGEGDGVPPAGGLAEEAETLFVDGHTARFSYRRFGKPSGVPLVLAMRFRGTLDHWDPALLNLLAREREVIVFDNRGIGASSGPLPGSIHDMARGLLEFVQALRLQAVDLLGWSLGGSWPKRPPSSDPTSSVD